MPVTVLGELYGAFQLDSRARENRTALAEFLAESLVAIVPTSAAVGGRARPHRARGHRAGDGGLNDDAVTPVPRFRVL